MNRKIWKLLVCLTVIVSIPFQAYGQGFAKVGIVGGQFLKLGSSAGTLAMGSASTAVVNDATALFWNPSGITTIENTSATLTHMSLFAGISYETGAVAKQFGNLGTFGLSFGYLTSGEMDITTYEMQEGTGETFAYSDMMVGLSWAKPLTDRFVFGGTVKLIREDYGIQDDIQGDNIIAQSFAFDLGTQYRTQFNSLRMGISLQNFGPESRPVGKYADIIGFDSKTQQYLRDEEEQFSAYPLPMTFRAGVAYDVMNSVTQKLTLATDVIAPSDNVQRLNLGAEYSLFNTLFIRGGYIYNADAANLSAGLGFQLAGIRIDYAYMDYGILNSIQAFSAVFNF